MKLNWICLRRVGSRIFLAIACLAIGIGRSDAVTSATPAADTPIYDKWALIIGISKFKDSSINLKYSAKDARDFSNFLIQEGNFAPDHVKLLLNEDATRENILSALGDKWLPRVANPNDLVVIYISSHGSPSGMDVGGVNYVLAEDTDKDSLFSTGIPMQDLVRIIKGRVHSDRIVLIMDACHSGAANADGKAVFHQGNVNVEEIVSGTGQLVISSSLPDQVSWESQKDPNGVFTHYLIEGLRQHGDRTTLGDAYSFMKDKVQDEVLRDRGVLQTPVLRSHWEGKDLALLAPPSRPRPGLKEAAPEVRAQTQTGSPGSSSPKPIPPSPAESAAMKPVPESQQMLWDTYMAAARQEVGRHNLLEARRMLADAQKEAEIFASGDPRRIITSKEIADVAYLQHSFIEAEPMYWTILPELERSSGPEDRKVVSVQVNLSKILVSKGKTDEAEKLAKRALSIEDKSGKPEPALTAGALDVLSLVNVKAGDLQQAEAQSRKALELRDAAQPADEPEIVGNLCALNQILIAEDKAAEAESLASRSLTMSEKNFGANSPETATCLETYAQVLNKLQKSVEAKRYESRAKSIRKKLSGVH